MRLLVLDCAANACAAAVVDDAGDLAALSEPMVRGHAERIAPMIAECLAAAATDTAALDAVVVTVGPGAFTGIRIGLAAARGFALAAGIPILGVSCLEVAAAPFKGLSPVLVALETKRADFYLQAFGPDGAALTSPAALPVEEIAAYLTAARHDGGDWPVTGDGGARLVAAAQAVLPGLHIVQTPETNSALVAGTIALARIAASGLPGPDDPGPRPLYLRPPDVNLKPPSSPLTAAASPRARPAPGRGTGTPDHGE